MMWTELMYRLLYSFSLLAYYLCLCLVQNKILDVKPRKYIVVIGGCYFLLSSAVISIQQIPAAAGAAFVVAPFLIPLFVKLSLQQCKLRSLFATYFFLISVYVIFSSILFYCINIETWVGDVIMSVVMITGCLIGCFTKLREKIRLVLLWIPLYLKRIIIVLSFASAIAVALMNSIKENANNTAWLNLTYAVFAVVIVLVCSILPILIAATISNKLLKHQAIHYKLQMEEQTKHYEAVAKSNWEIRRFQHDAKNLTVGLTSLLEQGQQGEALEMLNDYYHSSLGNKNALLQFDTGNGIVDALLAEKQQTALNINTTISFEGMVPADGIFPSHLCVLFGNTLDNALDACAKLPLEDEKTIGIVSKAMGGYFWLTVTNPVAENVKIKNNTVATTKEDKNHHGFGLYSLRKVAEEYQGEINLTCQNNLFKISVELNMEIK